MRHLIAYFIKYPVAGNTIMFLILVFGWFGLQSWKKNFFPVSPSRILKIETTYPGSSPEEIEQGIVLKIEDNLRGITGIEQINSVSQENSGVITIEVEKKYDTDLVLQDVKNAVDRIPSFPDGMEPPVIYKQEGRNFAISFSLSGDVSLNVLKSFAQKVESDLLAIDGLSKVALSGYPDEEVEVAIREDDLQAYNLTFAQVAQAVQNANLEITGGRVKGKKEELILRANTKGYYAEKFRDIVVKSSNGRLVYLHEVADVRDVWAEVPNRNYLNGEPSVIVEVSNTIEEDILLVTDNVKSYIEAFNAENDIVQATIVRDGSTTLNERIDLLLENGILGFFLVLLFLACFLHIRLAFWVALSIPISFMGMFILGANSDVSINVISLFGMILVVGILVDDGIVIGENIYKKFEEGMTPLRAAVEGTMQVLPAVVSAVLTTAIAFSTFFFLEGRLGEFAPDMAFVVISTLAISLVEGAFILPAHIAHSRALSKNATKNKLELFFDNTMKWLRDKSYGPFLRFSLNNWVLALSFPVALFLLTIGGIQGGFIKLTFFPFIEQDFISINLEMPSGTRESVTESILRDIQSAAWRVNDSLKANRADGKDIIENAMLKIGPSTNTGSVDIRLLGTEERQMQSFIISNAIRDAVGPVYEAEKLTFGISTPFGKPISVSLLGNNLSELESAKNELKEELKKLPALKDVNDNDKQGPRELQIKLKEKAYLLGLTMRDVISQVRQGYFGQEVQRLQRGLDEVKVWVRYDIEDRGSLNKLESMRIRTAGGLEVPFKEIAEYEIERGIVAINHLDGRREVRIEAELGDPTASTTEIMAEVRDVIIPTILTKHPSLRVSYEGQSKQQQKTAKSGKAIIPIILLLMFAVITLTFRSFWQAIVVFILIPFAAIGVGWGHYFHGQAISLLSMFGIIALIGVMVNDSLVFVSRVNELVKEYGDFNKAVYEAGISRFRAIVLTSVTTVAGLGPLIFETSFQAQFLIPMAISVAYGMMVATYITLIVLPVLLVMLNRVKVMATWFWTGKKPTYEEVEPAIMELESEKEVLIEEKWNDTY
ncbi:MAG: efflux RND transporter permease subunit [Flavobacteriales bacterium]|nr:efflux RND transporter permease subunit [Flavobacteriales bacterium]